MPPPLQHFEQMAGPSEGPLNAHHLWVHPTDMSSGGSPAHKLAGKLTAFGSPHSAAHWSAESLAAGVVSQRGSGSTRHMHITVPLQPAWKLRGTPGQGSRTEDHDALPCRAGEQTSHNGRRHLMHLWQAEWRDERSNGFISGPHRPPSSVLVMRLPYKNIIATNQGSLSPVSATKGKVPHTPCVPGEPHHSSSGTGATVRFDSILHDLDPSRCGGHIPVAGTPYLVLPPFSLLEWLWSPIAWVATRRESRIGKTPPSELCHNWNDISSSMSFLDTVLNGVRDE